MIDRENCSRVETKMTRKKLERRDRPEIFLNRVQETQVDHRSGGNYKSNKVSVMINFDVRNAFKLGPGDRIIKALETRGVSGYLIRVAENHLKNRILVVGEERSEMVPGGGVPQGSVLGPLL